MQHGVSMYFGSNDPARSRPTCRNETAGRADRHSVAEAISSLLGQRLMARFTHDLLPVPYTWEAVERAARNIREVQDTVGVPVAIENVSSYAEFHASEMTEWEFLSEVVERADCGILLDVNNIYVSSKNHTFDPFVYLDAVPAARVAQIHIAGHTKYERFILDTHDHPVLDPVWKLYAHAIARIGRTATLLEWDDRIPSFDEVHGEALKANRFLPHANTIAA